MRKCTFAPFWVVFILSAILDPATKAEPPCSKKSGVVNNGIALEYAKTFSSSSTHRYSHRHRHPSTLPTYSDRHKAEQKGSSFVSPFKASAPAFSAQSIRTVRHSHSTTPARLSLFWVLRVSSKRSGGERWRVGMARE